MPTTSEKLVLTYLFTALETAFHCFYFSFRNKKLHYGFYDSFSWPKDAYEYDGPNTHTPRADIVYGDLEATPEELEQVAADIKKSRLLKAREWLANRLATATPEVSARMDARKKISVDTTHKKNKAAKKYYRDVCDVNCCTGGELRNHKAGPLRIEAVARGGKGVPYRCEACNEDFHFESDYLV
ncbi:uncharacterized protein AB675_2633 [Cyphellophora attinorum]|uniref:Uncharacterized protein n=1 Tax=Cyphellophora attinorum TaxID=1664694 RepID=A0A0N0NRT6_9EURO|nr:uncharacterized protein AB675_2633 [Phialophora attinorum]KPI45209.1 hypothetical protein AB675_2633 [Phialophora attinorum]